MLAVALVARAILIVIAMMPLAAFVPVRFSHLISIPRQSADRETKL